MVVDHALMAENVGMRVAEAAVAAQVALETGLVLVLLLATGALVVFVCLALLLESVVVVVLDLLGALEILETHTTVGVPDQMAMHDPGTRVVGLEADDSPAGNEGGWGTTTEEQDSVTSDGIVELELSNHVRGENTTTLAEDGEVVTVKMHGVRGLEVVLNDKVYPLVGRSIKQSGVAVHRAVVWKIGQCGQGLKSGVLKGHVDGLAASRCGTVGAEIA